MVNKEGGWENILRNRDIGVAYRGILQGENTEQNNNLARLASGAIVTIQLTFCDIRDV